MLRLLIALLILAPSIAVGQTVVGASGNGVGFGAASGGASGDADLEARCVELGDACVCNETLQSIQTINSGGANNNPTASTTKECASGGNTYVTNPAGTVVAATGFPSGSTVQYMWRKDAQGIANLNGDSTTYGTGTFCYRTYQMWSDGYSLPSGAARDKIQQITSSELLGQSQWDWSGGSGLLFEVVAYGVDQSVSFTGDTITNTDCQASTGQCRFEMCIDHYANGDGNSRFRVTALGTGEVTTAVSNTWNTGTSPSSSQEWLANMYTDYNPGGYRYVSHGIQTYHATPDNTFWPGGTCEAEGGC